MVMNLVQSLGKIDETNAYYLFFGENRPNDRITPNSNFHEIDFQTGQIDKRWDQLVLPDQLEKYKIDVYHGTCFSLPVIDVCAKLITTVHDVVFLRHPELVDNNLREFLTWSTRCAVSLADEIHTVSNFSKTEIQSFFPETKNITVVYNGIDEKFFHEILPSEKERIKTKYCLPARYIHYLGSIEEKKNIINLIQAHKILLETHDVPLVLSGSRGGKLFDLDEVIDKFGDRQKIIPTGYVEENDLPGLIAAANVFVYPSTYEGFGLPALEAMALGTPTVVSDQTSLPEVADDGALVADAYSPNDISNNIDRLLTDQKIASDIVSKGKRRAAFFKWETTARRMLNLYEKTKN